MSTDPAVEYALEVDKAVKVFRRGRGLKRKKTRVAFGLAIIDRYTRRSGTFSHY